MCDDRVEDARFEGMVDGLGWDEDVIEKIEGDWVAVACIFQRFRSLSDVQSHVERFILMEIIKNLQIATARGRIQQQPGPRRLASAGFGSGIIPLIARNLTLES